MRTRTSTGKSVKLKLLAALVALRVLAATPTRETADFFLSGSPFEAGISLVETVQNQVQAPDVALWLES